MTKDERLKRAEDLLALLCAGLESDDVPIPDDLLDWWISYQEEEPKIQLLS